MNDERPTHPWNDPDHDGHNCVDCPIASMWKCDEGAHPEPFESADLLTEAERADLQANLDEMARTRARGAASAWSMPLASTAQKRGSSS